MAGFFYRRLISISRPAHQAASPAPGYGGAEVTNSAKTPPIFTGIPASVQSRGTASPNPAALPDDSRPGAWRIGIARGLIPDGEIRDRDIITDDLGRVFQVRHDYCHAMGWRLMCDRLE